MVNKKAQAWGFDLIVGTSIALIALVVFFVYAYNYGTRGDEKLDKLNEAGELVANSLLSSGYPENWQSGSVTKIGITSENKINNTKLEYFYNISQQDYKRTQAIFSIRYNYFVNLTDPIIINGNEIPGIGLYPQQSPTENIIKLTRFTIYNNKPSTLNILIWE